jgi:hypothetical protein
MVLSEGQQKILDILAQKSNHNPGMSVFDTAIIKESSLPGEEVKHLSPSATQFGSHHIR